MRNEWKNVARRKKRKEKGLKSARKTRPRLRSLPWKLLWNPSVLKLHIPILFTHSPSSLGPQRLLHVRGTSSRMALGASIERKSPNSSYTRACPSGPCHRLDSVCSGQIHRDEAGRVVTTTNKTRGFPRDDTPLIQSALTKLEIKFPRLKLQGET